MKTTLIDFYDLDAYVEPIEKAYNSVCMLHDKIATELPKDSWFRDFIIDGVINNHLNRSSIQRVIEDFIFIRNIKSIFDLSVSATVTLNDNESYHLTKILQAKYLTANIQEFEEECIKVINDRLAELHKKNEVEKPKKRFIFF